MSFISLVSDLNLVQNVPNSNYTDEEVIKIFKTIAHPLRLNILRFLLIDKEICTLEFEKLFNSYFKKYIPNFISKDRDSYSVAQPAITSQLTLMKKADILKKRKISFTKNEKSGKYDKIENTKGKWTYYRINEIKLPLIKQLVNPFIQESLRQAIRYENEDTILSVD